MGLLSVGVLTYFVISLVGSASTPISTPPPVPLPPPLNVSDPAPTPVPKASLTVDPTLTSTADPITLTVTILSPAENIDVEVGAARVLGVTLPDAAVEINGTLVDVASDGTFRRDLMLAEGINSIDVMATGPSGQVASRSTVVLFIPRREGVPLSVHYPHGLEVKEPTIIIVGATRQDAVVGVNGVPVDVNALGIFSTTVSLEEGANLIQVVAVDIEENVNFQTVTVFYLP